MVSNKKSIKMNHAMTAMLCSWERSQTFDPSYRQFSVINYKDKSEAPGGSGSRRKDNTGSLVVSCKTIKLRTELCYLFWSHFEVHRFKIPWLSSLNSGPKIRNM